ncbi:molybdenum cofactor biosynthesis protein MoaE [Humisphaera borealis]|uniref:Molybdopterin synthase catalytic subunit n=1 Tax=Humisphaera borealis TaxID=2807512 RepID=A0A7M2WYQ9_9BACT|nr:molybdenum cofactor biosynthesis protein MoaE [Humisphaera borealis]QOV89981.1 molybdenum cofactor biosynthesis protein MoaE [Humisphaera borealis]
MEHSVAYSQFDRIELTAADLDIAAALAFVASPLAGGIDLFVGTTRAEQAGDGRELVALDYEAYVEMAIDRLRRLAADARRQWPIVKLAILHRTGRVPVGEPSVAIAVACGHRAEAFAACRWLIDTLKADVPIWKKEIWADGEGTWVHR